MKFSKQEIPENKSHLTTFPSIKTINRFSQSEKTNMSDFCVSNFYGSVLWPGVSDISDFDFSNWIKISLNSIEVYPDQLFSASNPKPEMGSKLNKTAILTFNNIIGLDSQISANDFKKKLKRLCKNQSAEFISFNPQTRILIIRVQHFTKFAFNDLEIEQAEEEEMRNVMEQMALEEESQELSIHSEKQKLSNQNIKKISNTQNNKKRLKNSAELLDSKIKASPQKNEDILSPEKELLMENIDQEEIQKKMGAKQLDYMMPSELTHLDFILKTDRTDNQSFASLAKELKTFANNLENPIRNYTDKIEKLSASVVNKISIYNLSKNKEVFSKDPSKPSQFIHRNKPTFCWTSNTQLSIITQMIPLKTLCVPLPKQEFDKELEAIFSEVLRNSELSLVSDFKFGTINYLSFYKILFLIFKQFVKRPDLKLDSEKANLWAFLELFLSLFVCHSLSPDEIIKSQKMSQLIEEELLENRKSKNKNPLSFKYEQRRKLVKWLETIIQEKSETYEEAYFNKIEEEENDERLSFQAALWNTNKETKQNADKRNFFSFLKQLMEIEQFCSMDLLVSQLLKTQFDFPLDSFEKSILMLLTLYVDFEKENPDLFGRVISSQIEVVAFELNSILMICFASLQLESKKGNMQEQFGFLQNSLNQIFMNRKMFNIGFIWQLAFSDLFKHSLSTFDQFVHLYFLEDNLSDFQTSTCQEILNKLSQDNQSAFHRKYNPIIAKSISHIINGHNSQILDFYVQQNMEVESLNFFVRNICQEQLETVVFRKEHLPFLENYVDLLSKIQRIGCNPLFELIRNYLEVIRVFHDPLKIGSDEKLSRNIDSVFRLLKQCQSIKGVSVKEFLTNIRSGVLDMICLGLFNGFAETQTCFEIGVINGCYDLSIPKEKFDEILKKLSYIV